MAPKRYAKDHEILEIPFRLPDGTVIQGGVTVALLKVLLKPGTMFCPDHIIGDPCDVRVGDKWVRLESLGRVAERN